MRRFLLVFVFMALVGWGVHAQETGDVAAQAAAAYEAGDYNTAIVLYESLLEAGSRRGAVYFNLGSAYYRSGALGRAQLNFRRAQQFIPRDGDLNRAMVVIRQERIDVQGDETILMDLSATLTANVLTVRELSLFVFLVWAGLVGVGVTLFLRPDWRPSLAPFLVVLGVVFVILLGLWGNRAAVERFRPLAVLAAETPFYSGSSRDYLEIFQLSPAAEMRIVEQRDGWGRAVLPDGRQGWVFMDDVLLVRDS